ncbi:MAG: hypothetical protein ACKV2V_01860 [Blastocatellia bacterium]
MTSRTLTQMFLSLAALVVLAMSAFAGDPGAVGPARVNDQAAGPILIYNAYSSSSTNPAAENTRIAITNKNDQYSQLVHLFFVDGATCSVADNFVCLTKSQTMTLLASDVDPDVRGYIVAIQVNDKGEPVLTNRNLIGDAYIKLATGHSANLGAEAIISATATAPDANMTARVTIAVPRVVAADNIPSAKDGNDTLLILNRLYQNNLLTGGFDASNNGGGIFGLLFDELENSYSYTINFNCQIRQTLSDSFPRTTPRFTSVVPAGTSGWTKMWSTGSTVGLLGATINKNTTMSATSFSGGHNLHKLTYTSTYLLIPVFPAMGCGTQAPELVDSF